MKRLKINTYGFLVMLLLAIISIVILKQFSSLTDDKVLINGFNNSKAELYKADVNYWAKINTEFMTKNELKRIVVSVCKKLNLKNTNNIQVSNKKGVNQAIWVQNINKIDNSTIIVAESISNTVQHKSESYLIIDDDLGKNIKRISTIKEKLSKVYKKYSCKPITTISLIGRYDYRLKKNEINKIERDVFNSIDAKVVQRINTKDLNTVTAYSPMLNNPLQQKSSKVNVNISCNYNESDKKTYLYLATPVITNEY